MAPIAVAAPNPNPIESLKASVASVTLNEVPSGSADLRSYAHFDATPSIGTEFREYSAGGKPVLNIRDVLGDEAKLRALGRLV
jgi:hypothetical protein